MNDRVFVVVFEFMDGVSFQSLKAEAMVERLKNWGADTSEFEDMATDESEYTGGPGVFLHVQTTSGQMLVFRAE